MDLVKRKERSKCEAEGKQEAHDHILWLCADKTEGRADQGCLSHVASVLPSV